LRVRAQGIPKKPYERIEAQRKRRLVVDSNSLSVVDEQCLKLRCGTVIGVGVGVGVNVKLNVKYILGIERILPPVQVVGIVLDWFCVREGVRENPQP